VVRIFTAAALLLIVAGCVAPEEPDIATRRSALGEPTNGFPTAAERLGIMAINRARSDPQTVHGAQSATYAARPPVMWSYDLSRSSRFHATHLRLSNVTLMHSSPCPLNPNVATAGCDGNPTCACATPVPAMCAACATVAAVNTCGTDTFARIAFFTAGTTTRANGEVAAAGYTDAMAVVDGWMDEAAGNDGHRKNLTDQGITSNTMGYGRSAGAACFSSFDVSDSASISGLVIAKLPTAAVRGPTNGAAGSYAFYATWADPVMGAPATINVVVDGACTVMARELGNDMLNATYKATLALTAGCHNYYVVAKDAAGTTMNFPTTGAITIPVASATACTSDFMATAPAATCSGTPPPPPADAGAGTGGATGTTGAGGNRGTGGVTGTTGAGGNRGGTGGTIGTTGAGGATGTTGAGGSSGSGTGGGAPTSNDAGARPTSDGGGISVGNDLINGGCGCAVTGTPPLSRAAGTLLAFGILLSARRRRRR
jgi:MYXO-CTERM domain-containing protein